MSRLFQRFADPATELDYLRSERTARARPVRALIVVAAMTLLSYIVMNPAHFPREGALAYSQAALFFIFLTGLLFVATSNRFYLEHGWVDLPIFLAFLGAMAWLTSTLMDQAAVTGFPPHVMAMVQMAILVIFASLAFAGTVGLFFLWAAGVLAAFAAWLLALDVPQISKIYTLSNFSTLFIFALYFNWELDRRARSVFAANAELVAERRKTEALLYNVLPREVAARLKAGEAVADAFSDVTVVFVDLVDFSKLSRRLSPGHLVKLLNTFFSAADRCADRHGLEKVKTIGDAYLAVVGGMASHGRESGAAIHFARDLVAELGTLSDETGIDLRVRIGIHTGPVVGGVIGSSRLAYDYWGDTMNIASRLQAVAPANGLAVSEATYYQVKAMQDFEEPQSALLKGIGETPVYVARLGHEETQ
jgi:class 3 adenylate cyclase